jgi:hypothetical protein
VTSPEAIPEELVWATRGRSWGFRFLLTAGLPDPLSVYERVVAPLGDDTTGWCRGAGAGAVAVRFLDPLGRRDAAGRVIPHDFVLFGDAAEGVASVDDGLQRVWPLVAEAYGRVWDADGPPSAAELFPA